MILLTLPGIGGSGPGHWQTRWERQDPRFRRVEQRDWNRPDCRDWVDALDRAVAAAGEDTMLVAHSLGCLLVAHWAAQRKGRAAGALLVAPADPDNICFPPQAVGFAPVPMQRLPFPSTLVASTDDPFSEPGFAGRCAAAWGSQLVVAGPLGHINADSGLGDWPQGQHLLDQLVRVASAS